MWVFTQTFRGSSRTGWHAVSDGGKVVQKLRFDPRDLSDYSRAYIRRAIRTGVLPDKRGPTDARARMVLYAAEAAYVVTSGDYRTDVAVYDFDTAYKFASHFGDFVARFKLLCAATTRDGRETSHTGQSIGVTTRSRAVRNPEMDEFYLKDSYAAETKIETPAGPKSLGMWLAHEFDQRDVVASLVTTALGPLWCTDAQKQNAHRLMSIPFSMQVETIAPRRGESGREHIRYGGLTYV